MSHLGYLKYFMFIHYGYEGLKSIRIQIILIAMTIIIIISNSNLCNDVAGWTHAYDFHAVVVHFYSLMEIFFLHSVQENYFMCAFRVSWVAWVADDGTRWIERALDSFITHGTTIKKQIALLFL